MRKAVLKRRGKKADCSFLLEGVTLPLLVIRAAHRFESIEKSKVTEQRKGL